MSEETTDSPNDVSYFFSDSHTGLPSSLPEGKLDITGIFEFVKFEIEDLIVQAWRTPKKFMNCDISGEVYIGEGVDIGSFTTIQGPVYIGDNVKIGSGALIRPGSVIADNCVIGHSAEVKNSIVLRGAKLQSFSFTGDSLIGKGTRIASGVIIANRRFDQGSISQHLEGDDRKTDTGREFLGAVVGDYARVGAGTVLFPGTLVGPYTWITPNCSVSGFIPRAKKLSQRTESVLKDNEEVELSE